MTQTKNKVLNKSEFINHIAKQHGVTNAEAEKVINMFTTSITSALAKKLDVQLIGFGEFYTNEVAARSGRNPKTGAAIKIDAYTAVKFSAGKKLKDACND